MIGPWEILVGIYVLLVACSVVLAARQSTSWFSVVLVVLFPFIGFLFVLWDVFRSSQEADSGSSE